MTPVGKPPIAAIGVYWAFEHQPTAAQARRVQGVADAAAAALDRIGMENAPKEPWAAPPSVASP